MNKKIAKSFLDTAIEEIDYALNLNKSEEVEKVYLENAIRFIQLAKEKLDS